MIKVGITGTRLTPAFAQLDMTYRILSDLWENGSELHQGCCTGYDESTIIIASVIKYKIVGHPPIDQKFITSKYILDYCHSMKTPKEYLDRNKDIVDETDLLIAAPLKLENENPRSGTWSTIRYAKKMKKNITILFADGKVEEWHALPNEH